MEKTFNKIIAQKIDNLRVLKGFSFRELATNSGISHSTLSDIIQGKTIPNILTLHSICTALESHYQTSSILTRKY